MSNMRKALEKDLKLARVMSRVNDTMEQAWQVRRITVIDNDLLARTSVAHTLQRDLQMDAKLALAYAGIGSWNTSSICEWCGSEYAKGKYGDYCSMCFGERV